MTAQLLSNSDAKIQTQTGVETKTYINHQKVYRFTPQGELIEYSYTRTKPYICQRKKPLISSYFIHNEEEENTMEKYKNDRVVLASQLTPLLNKNNPDKPRLTEKQVKDYLYRTQRNS